MIKNKSFLDLFILWFLLAVSAFPFFYLNDEFLIFGLFLSLFISYRKAIKLNSNEVIIILVFVTIELIQMLYFGSTNFKTIIGIVIKLIFALLVVKINGENFIKNYIKIIYFFSITSLFFYSTSLISPYFLNFYLQLTSFFKPLFALENLNEFNSRPSIIFHTFEPSLWNMNRNAGPFWEPGAFTVFLNLALIFNLVVNKKLISNKNLLFVICIITTFSTAGYIALFIILVFVILKFNLNIKIKYSLILILVIIFFNIYNKFDFLGQKVEDNYSTIYKHYGITGSRFGSAVADLSEFSQSPIIGWGRGSFRNKATSYVFEFHRNNGITNLLATYGILLTVFYFYLYYKFAKSILKISNLNVNLAYIILLVFFILGFSQSIFLRPFFFTFLFLSISLNNSLLAKSKT